MEAEANLIIGQRPVCGATSERQRRREGVQQEVQQPYNLSQTDGCVYRVCAAEKPTKGCDIFHFEQLLSTYVWSLDNDEVLQRRSDPEAPMVTDARSLAAKKKLGILTGRRNIQSERTCGDRNGIRNEFQTKNYGSLTNQSVFLFLYGMCSFSHLGHMCLVFSIIFLSYLDDLLRLKAISVG